MVKIIGILAFLALVEAGCSNANREQELQRQLSQVQAADSTMREGIADRDKYMEQVMTAVNESYASLEKARVREGGVAERATGVEGSAKKTNVVTREDLLKDLREISSTLQENRKRIGTLQSKNRSNGRQLAGLDTLIENLKVSLKEREESIAQLQGRIQGLEANVAENTRTIAGKDSLLDLRLKAINTAYYVIGTRDELKRKGIISDAGGFLWGLLGSTTVLADSLDESRFSPVDRTKGQLIQVDGKIDQILPKRIAGTFAMAGSDSALTIISPEKFWQQRYLVIVVEGRERRSDVVQGG